MIPHSRPTLSKDDSEAVLKVMESGHLSQGNMVSAFEKELSSFVGVERGAAVSSGSAGLHLSLIALKVEQGDEVIIPSYVCSALLNVVRYMGAVPVLADIEPDAYNIDVKTVKELLTRKTKAIIAPHLFGLPADIDALLSFGVPVIEDCAQSIGARYQGSYTGSFGILSVFSFYATKMLACGEGGMVLSKDKKLIETIRDLRDYNEKETYRIRFNYKMTDIQAALGISQLKKLSCFIGKRKEIASRYSQEFQETIASVPIIPEGREHIYFRYVILMENVDDFIGQMKSKMIMCRRPVFKPLDRYLGLAGYPVTDRIWKRAVSLPIYPSLKEDEVNLVIKETKRFFERIA
jgi:dTDP-4-amino-4,6-dideoxygalactose transaminase